MQLEAARPAKKQVISLTPLIDVVFILLLFFMLTSSFTRWNALEVKPPATAVQPVESLPVLVRLHQDALVEINGKRLGLHESSEQFRALLVEHEGKPLIVQPQPEVTAQQIVTLFDLLRAAGATAVTLANVQP